MVGFFYLNVDYKSKYNEKYRDYYKEYLREAIGELNRYIEKPQELNVEEIFKEVDPYVQVAGEDIKVFLENLDKKEYSMKLGIDISVMLRTYRHHIIQSLESLNTIDTEGFQLQLKYKKVVNESNPSLCLRITTTSSRKFEVLNLSFPYELAKYDIKAAIIFSYLISYLMGLVIHNPFRKK